jgi:putative membrane protein
MKTKIGVLAVAVAALTQAPAFGQEAGWATFLADAIRGNLAEVQMGQLAQQRGRSDAVKQFGKTLATDHGMGLEQSKALAERLGVAPPTQPSAEAMETYTMLMRLSGEQFDDEFAKHMVMDHQKDIAAYRSQATGATNMPVAELAKSTLPTLEAHLKTAQSLAGDHAGH